MKLIDAEKLRAEIERLKAKYRKDMYKSNYEGLASGYKIEAYNELLLSLDSLQQEQQEYIRKDALVKWLNNRISDGDEEGLMTNQIANLAYKDVIEKLNEL